MRVAPVTAALALACACGPGEPASPNPSVLWLALDGSETEVLLQAAEPPPF
ncbi:MAG: hypothetical protein R2939_14025 [Kofleriaceae bacterium]